jgi:phosphoserine phosphatase
MLLTVMGGDQTGIVAMLSGIFFENGINIESVKMIARGDYIAMEIALDISDLNDMFAFRKILYEFSDKTGLDVSLRGDDIFQKPKKVVVFDCDSTLIQSEVIDELGKMAKVSERVKEMTDRAMKGELDFKQAVKERVRLLKGLPAEQLELLSKTIRLTPGAEELISMLHFMGYKVAVISGGFSFFTNYLKKRLHLDYVYTNELVIRDGEITGEIKGDIIDAEKKGEIIQEIAELENISVDQIVAVGDGANDRFMLENAGLAIAFSPKEILKKYSDGIINNDNIFGLLYFLGIPESHLKELRKNKDQKNLSND